MLESGSCGSACSCIPRSISAFFFLHVLSPLTHIMNGASATVMGQDQDAYKGRSPVFARIFGRAWLVAYWSLVTTYYNTDIIIQSPIRPIMECSWKSSVLDPMRSALWWNSINLSVGEICNHVRSLDPDFSMQNIGREKVYVYMYTSSDSALQLWV